MKHYTNTHIFMVFPKSKKYLLKLIFLGLVTANIISGCASVKTQYYEAQSAGTTDAYKQFLANNPRGFYAKKTRKALDQLEFKEAIASRNEKVLERLLHDTQYPKTDLAIQANEVVAQIKSSNIRKNESLNAYKDFYLKFGKTVAASELEDSFDMFYGRLVLSSHTLDDYTGYITRFPHGKSVSAVRINGEKLWWPIHSKNITVENYSHYLDLFPDGAHQKNVKNILEKLMWEQAEKSATNAKLYVSYLARLPDGLHKSQAKDNVDWSIAEKKGPKAIRFYLNQHPKGHFAERGRKILKESGKVKSTTVHDAAWRKIKSALQQNSRGFGASSIWGSISSGKTFISYRGSIAAGGKAQIFINNNSRFEMSGKVYTYYNGDWFPVYEHYFKKHSKQERKSTEDDQT